MTDSHERYGPRTAVVEAIVKRVMRLTDDEIHAMTDVWRVIPYGSPLCQASLVYWSSAYSAAHNAAKATARLTAWFAAWTDASGVAWDFTADAACAATVADLVGQHGLERWHLEMLTDPWRAAIKDVDPLEGISDD